MNESRAAVRVFFPCTGLGRQRRGYETFTRSCARALAAEAGLEITVFGGGGELLSGEESIVNAPRDGMFAREIGAFTKRDPYFVEQATFFAGFLPRLATGKPDVVYFADLNLGNACWHWRRVSGQRFRLLFYNGGATTKPFTRSDLVQQVSPEHLASAIVRGEPAERQVLLPHGVDIAEEFTLPSMEERAAARQRLGIPGGRPLLLTVGMQDAQVKRTDYVIREIASLGDARPHLMIAGAISPETPQILLLARELLGESGFTARTLEPAEMALAYCAADAFVLASLREGFGLAILEAMAAGLTCVVHDTPTTEYLCGPHAVRTDLRTPGALAPRIAAALASPPSAALARARHDWVRERFSWDTLRPRYAELFLACAAGRTPAW